MHIEIKSKEVSPVLHALNFGSAYAAGEGDLDKANLLNQVIARIKVADALDPKE